MSKNVTELEFSDSNPEITIKNFNTKVAVLFFVVLTIVLALIPHFIWGFGFPHIKNIFFRIMFIIIDIMACMAICAPISSGIENKLPWSKDFSIPKTKRYRIIEKGEFIYLQNRFLGRWYDRYSICPTWLPYKDITTDEMCAAMRLQYRKSRISKVSKKKELGYKVLSSGKV